MNATTTERETPEMEAATEAVHLDALALASAAAAVAAVYAFAWLYNSLAS